LKYAKIVSLMCCFALLVSLLAACSGQAAKIEPRGKAYFEYFDTVSYIYSYAGDSAELFDQRCAEVSGILSGYHKLFDIYHEYSGVNNLCTVNKNAGGEAVPVDPELIEFLLYARELYETTHGEMNVAMGPVLKIWHDHRTQAGEDPAQASVPSVDALQNARQYADISLLEIDAGNNTVRLADANAALDVGALGKGYATERAAEYLRGIGAEAYVLNIGGNIRIIGAKPDGSGWVTGLRDPNSADGGLATKLVLKDTACVTSGVYERFFTVEGVRYHHIIDPDTLFPANYFASLTIIAQDSALADALSTALFCMPYADGLAMIEAMEGVDAVWIFSDGEIRYSSGLEDCIQK